MRQSWTPQWRCPRSYLLVSAISPWAARGGYASLHTCLLTALCVASRDNLSGHRVYSHCQLGVYNACDVSNCILYIVTVVVADLKQLSRKLCYTYVYICRCCLLQPTRSSQICPETFQHCWLHPMKVVICRSLYLLVPPDLVALYNIVYEHSTPFILVVDATGLCRCGVTLVANTTVVLPGSNN